MYATATTTREAVTKAINDGSDHWELRLEEGILKKAQFRNQLAGNSGSVVRDKMRMEMCTRYGRHWCEIGA